MAQPENVTIWQARQGTRMAGYGLIALLTLLSVFVLMRFGYYAVIGVGLVALACGSFWWQVLRPRLIAGPEGVEVLVARAPVRLGWKEVHRAEVVREGLKIVAADGREVISKVPLHGRPEADGQTEVARVAAFLQQRAQWARRGGGPAPVYTPPTA